MSVLFEILLNLLQDVMETIRMKAEIIKKEPFFNMGAKIILLEKRDTLSTEECLGSKVAIFLKNSVFLVTLVQKYKLQILEF